MLVVFFSAVSGYAFWRSQTEPPARGALAVFYTALAFGVFAKGPDLDMIMIVHGSEEPFERRAARWDTTELPVPAELLVYTTAEWEGLAHEAASIRR